MKAIPKTLAPFAVCISLIIGPVNCIAQLLYPDEEPTDGLSAAAASLRAAAERGDSEAQFGLGAAYSSGLFVRADLPEAVKWYRKAAEQGHKLAQDRLGYLYAVGKGVGKDAAEAARWYRKSAVQGVAESQESLGYLYFNGDGVPKNLTEAAVWFRKAAEQHAAGAQKMIAAMYFTGEGVPRKPAEAAKWYRRAADQGDASAQCNLGILYATGKGVKKDAAEAAKWYRKAADVGYASAQFNLAVCYDHGQGVGRDVVEAMTWYRKAAEQNVAQAQLNLGICYATGRGVVKDEVEGYKWTLLAAGQGNEPAKKAVTLLEDGMTREQRAEGQKLARNFKPREIPPVGSDSSSMAIVQTRPESSGTGFFITGDGYLITNEHVAGNGAQVRLVTASGLIFAKVVRVDAANDLALLKAEGKFSALPVASSRAVRLGGTVATVGFPNIGLQGFAPKLAKGEIASLSGAGDDARYFQVSVPVQPGNSGGALVDERGNVVGVVSAKLSARAALAATGALPENVNYAVKSSFLLGFLESVPEVSAKLKEPESKERKFEDVVKSAERAAVLVLVY